MGLFTSIASSLVGPRIVHSLPGRLRVAMPGLKQLAGAFQVAPSGGSPLGQNSSGAAIDAFLRLIGSHLTGVLEVSANPTAGTVLVSYDINRASEASVMHGLRLMVSWVIHNRRTLESLKDRPTEQILPLLDESVAQVFRTGDHRQEIEYRGLA